MKTPVDLNNYCDNCEKAHEEFGNLCAACEAKETAEQEEKIANAPITSTLVSYGNIAGVDFTKSLLQLESLGGTWK